VEWTTCTSMVSSRASRLLRPFLLPSPISTTHADANLCLLTSLFLSALGIADEVEQYGLKGNRKKKGRKLGEDFMVRCFLSLSSLSSLFVRE